MAPPADASPLQRVLDRIGPVSAAAARAAQEHQGALTKPPGSMGELELLGSRLAGMYGVSPPPLPAPSAIAVFAGDHGVHAQGVSPWPQEVTAQMVTNLMSGGAVVNALARQVGATVLVVDVGVADDLPHGAGVLGHKVAAGTADLSRGPAMTAEQAEAALDVGVEVAESLVAQGHRLLVTGDMGIANTTPSAALISMLTGAPVAEVTGRGTGVDDATLAHKVEVITRAIEVNGLAGRDLDLDPMRVLAAVGGLEHAALVGYLLAAAAHRTPVVLDGVIACSAALVAGALCPPAADCWIAGHRSVEPGAATALAHLRLTPLLDLGLRLGEGSGAVLAVPLVQAAARMLREVATFDSAGVTGKDGGT